MREPKKIFISGITARGKFQMREEYPKFRCWADTDMQKS